MIVLTLGDSVLDSARYSGTTAGQIVAERLDAQLLHFAKDGATSRNLEEQWWVAERALQALRTSPSLVNGTIAMISAGGNDFLGNPTLSQRERSAIGERITKMVVALRVNGIKSYVANIYDPTFGDDAKDPLGIPASKRRIVRQNLDALNAEIANCLDSKSVLVDLHEHFLKGDPSWYALDIEPSETGANEVAKAFLARISRGHD